MNKKLLLPSLLATLLGFSCLFSSLMAQNFKVVGYLPYYRFSHKDNIDFSKITHLCIAFINPDANGNMGLGDNEDPVIATARAQNPDLKVLASLAGGALTAQWATAWQTHMQPAKRAAFIHKIIQYCYAHDYDGIDVDLEWSHVTSDYSPFVIQLADSAKAHDLLMTAAWPGTTRYSNITNAALAVFDFINLMVYDLTGPWAPNNPGPHSPYSFAVQSINYWNNQGVTGNRMTLGVPFYGYDFTNSSNVSSFTFRQMVNEDTAFAWVDQDGLRYYNGIPTIRSKTRLAMDEVSGIMIWELGQDALGAISTWSLLDAIDETIDENMTSLEDKIALQSKAYPNPFQDQLFVETNELFGEVEVSIADLSGRKILIEHAFADGSPIGLNTSEMPKGFYLFTLSHNGQSITQKLIKR